MNAAHVVRWNIECNQCLRRRPERNDRARGIHRFTAVFVNGVDDTVDGSVQNPVSQVAARGSSTLPSAHRLLAQHRLLSLGGTQIACGLCVIGQRLSEGRRNTRARRLEFSILGLQVCLVGSELCARSIDVLARGNTRTKECLCALDHAPVRTDFDLSLAYRALRGNAIALRCGSSALQRG